MTQASPSVSLRPSVANANRALFRLFHFLTSARAKFIWRWAIFLYLILVLCPIRFDAPDNKTIDNTWRFALNYAADHHLVMGRDIVWTWGPLFYLLFPFDIGNNLAQGLAFQCALWVLLIVVLWDLFFRGVFSLRNLAVFSILIGLSTLDYNQTAYPGNLLLYPALILLVHYRLRGGIIRYVSALAIIGLVPLLQIFGTLIAIGALAGFIVDLFLRDDIRRALNIALAMIVPTAVAIVGCRLALGSFHAIASYLKWNSELLRGYSFAMSISGPRVVVLSALEGISLLMAALVLLMLRDRAKSQFFLLFLVVPVLLNLKHGFVRQDVPHVAFFFCFLAFACALVILAIPLDWGATNVVIAVVLLVFAILWQDYAASSDLGSATVAVTGIDVPLRLWDATRFAHLRYSLNAEGLANYSTDARIEPEIKSIVGGEPVAFLSDVYSDALLDGLNLALFPVIQRYSAYTPRLDQLDATWIDEKGPRFLIFDGTAIDGRHPWAESPATWTEVYRWYNTKLLGGHNLLLQRRDEPRFTRFEPIEHRTIRVGEDLTMPLSADPVFWTMRCPLSTSGELRALLTRVPAVMMDMNYKDGRTGNYRVILPVLEGPSLGTQLPSSLAEFAEVFSELEDRDRDFLVAKLAFRSLGNAYRSDCKVELLRALP
jgi:hypothetical protein